MKNNSQDKIEKLALTKVKSQGQPQQDKANSIFIARELITGDPANYPKRLLEFKNIKHQNYEKFTQRIQQNLAKGNFNFTKSYGIFIDISHVAEDQNTTGHQMNSILEGFSKFWAKCEIEFSSMQTVFDFIGDIYCHIAKNYIKICKDLILSHLEKDFEYFREQGMKFVNKYYRGSKAEEDKILTLVHEFDLYDAFGKGKVIEIAMRSPNANEIAFIFKNDQGYIQSDLVKLYIDKCVQRDSKQDLKKCETIIKVLKLDPYEYENMIDKMVGRYVNYQLRSFKLYFIELVMQYDLQLIKALVRQLIKQNRHKEAKYFIVNYELENNKYYGELDKRQIESLSKIRNILIDNDYFGPTEIQVLQENTMQAKNVLYMKNLGLEESDITFIDQSNINQINIEENFSTRVIGMDTQTTGGVHVFDQPRMTLLQIFTGRHIFIFDYINLVKNKKLKEIIKYIFAYCKIYGHDHQKEITSIQKELKLDIDEKIMQQLQRSRLLDTSKYFKKIFPKETKSNLVYITEFLLKKSVSKYEQCSGWRNRPLRKAQLHYASIDCILPLLLGEKLEELERSKMK